MIGLIGYNFCSDSNSVDPTPTNINNITNTRLQNGIFDHFNVTRNVAFDYNSIIPTDWDIDTIMNADFKGNASAGNVEQMTAGITSVCIKRRVKGTFDWITIKQIPVSKPEDLSFIVTDNLNAYNTEYEYAFVPVMEVFKFHAVVEYNNNTSNQQVGVFQPYNRQYPVVVSNSIINYQTGTFGGWVLPDDFDNNRQLNRVDITKEKEALLKFLLNKKPKIIKDMNGNNWLVYFTGNPTLSYDNNYGQGMVKVNAEWTEVGDPNDKTDLYENGLIPTKR